MTWEAESLVRKWRTFRHARKKTLTNNNFHERGGRAFLCFLFFPIPPPSRVWTIHSMTSKPVWHSTAWFRQNWKYHSWSDDNMMIFSCLDRFFTRHCSFLRKMKILPPLRFFLCRLWRQQAIRRMLMRTNPVPDVTPISISRPRDVFVPEPSVVSVCCVVNVDMDCCGGAEFPCSYEICVFFNC